MRVPTAIVLVQSRPGQISRDEVERLHAAAPLARLVALVGDWCEGELRNGQAWAGVIRVPASAWRWRLEHELGLAGGNGSLLRRVPRTATAAERIESMQTQVPRRDARRLTAVVYSSRRANYEGVADMMRQLGVQSVCEGEVGARVGKVDVIIFDGWEQVSSLNDRFLDRQDGVAPPRVLLLHFPREEDFERARREGIEAVVAKPALLTDLAGALGMGVSNAAGSVACASG